PYCDQQQQQFQRGSDSRIRPPRLSASRRSQRLPIQRLLESFLEVPRPAWIEEASQKPRCHNVQLAGPAAGSAQPQQQRKTMASASQSPNCNAPIGTAVAAGGGPGSSRGVVAFPSDFKQRERRRASMQDAIDASKINADLYSKLPEGQQHRLATLLTPRGGAPNRKNPNYHKNS
uniref:SUZ domain-containing protein n=1 Tax=Macrostomum lignano TaxID=282301 RepID=A0A1I8FF50_9PLAT